MDLIDILTQIGLWLWSIIKFLVFIVKSIFNLIFKSFNYIFSDYLFDNIGDTFSNLALYIGFPSASGLLGLFFLAFLFIFLSFIFKIIKGQVSYKATTKKFLKK